MWPRVATACRAQAKHTVVAPVLPMIAPTAATKRDAWKRLWASKFAMPASANARPKIDRLKATRVGAREGWFAARSLVRRPRQRWPVIAQRLMTPLLIPAEAGVGAIRLRVRF